MSDGMHGLCLSSPNLPKGISFSSSEWVLWLESFWDSPRRVGLGLSVFSGGGVGRAAEGELKPGMAWFRGGWVGGRVV